jgi:hypothetical protein
VLSGNVQMVVGLQRALHPDAFPQAVLHASMQFPQPLGGVIECPQQVGDPVCAKAGEALTDWITGTAQATAPVIAALRRNSRRFSPFVSSSAMWFS